MPSAVSLTPPKYAVGNRVRLGKCRTKMGDYSGCLATVREVEIMYAEVDNAGHFVRRGLHIGGHALPEGSTVTGDALTITNRHGTWHHREHHWSYHLQVDGLLYGLIVDEPTVAGYAPIR